MYHFCNCFFWTNYSFLYFFFFAGFLGACIFLVFIAFLTAQRTMASASSKTISSELPRRKKVHVLCRAKYADVCMFMPFGLFREQIRMNADILRKHIDDNISYYASKYITNNPEHQTVMPNDPSWEVVLALSFIFEQDVSKWSSRMCFSTLHLVWKETGYSSKRSNWHNVIEKHVLKMTDTKYTQLQLQKLFHTVKTDTCSESSSVESCCSEWTITPVVQRLSVSCCSRHVTMSSLIT